MEKPKPDEQSDQDGGAKPDDLHARSEVLLQAAKDGDEDAWRQMDVRFRRMLRIVVHGKLPPALRGRFATEDVGQEAMHGIVGAIRSFEYRGPGSLERWFRRTLHNALLNLRRQHFMDRRDARRDADLFASKVGGNLHALVQSPSQFSVSSERLYKILSAMGELSDELGGVISLRFQDSLKISEIAERTGLSETTVRRRLRTAIDRLQRILLRRGGAGDAEA